MMNLFRRSSRVAARRSMLPIVLVALVLIIAALDFAFGGSLRALSRAALTPALRSMNAASAQLIQKEFWSSRAALMDEIDALKADLFALQGRAASYEALQLENEALRSLVKLAEVERGTTAPVISSFRASPYGTFLIGAGSEAGIKAGDLVLIEGGYVLGVVTDAAQGSALVRSALAPGSQHNVVAGSVGFSLEGRGGGNGRAQVPREASLREGDPVIAPSLGGRPLGVIGKIESEESSAYADIYVVLPVNLNSIRFVHTTPGPAL